MRFLKKTTHKELMRIWGFYFPLPHEAIDTQLYLVVRKNGTPSKVGGGRYITEKEVKENDTVLP